MSFASRSGGSILEGASETRWTIRRLASFTEAGVVSTKGYARANLGSPGRP
jgi:hypothetical protein